MSLLGCETLENVYTKMTKQMIGELTKLYSPTSTILLETHEYSFYKHEHARQIMTLFRITQTASSCSSLNISCRSILSSTRSSTSQPSILSKFAPKTTTQPRLFPQLMFVRHATHKASRAANGPGDSPGQRLGAKKTGGMFIPYSLHELKHQSNHHHHDL